MNLLPIRIAPGVKGNGTEYQAKGRYFDANLVRWENGQLMPVGGWQRINRDDPFAGVCRGLFPWRNNNAQRFLAVGTNTNLYAWSDRGFLYDITPDNLVPGRVDAIFGLGYGAAAYGLEAWGTPRSGDTKVLDAATWSFDAFGQNLIACFPTDGRIFQWDLDFDGKAEPITNAPIENRGVFVSFERHVVALGAGGNPRRVAWSSREDPTDWTPTATNTAGDFDLQTVGRLQQAVKVRGQVLILTNQDVHTMTFVGGEFVYGFELVGSACGTGSQNSAVATDDFAVWMCENGFHIWDGTVRSLPCEVEDYVYSDINLLQFSKVVAGVNQQFNEAWWYYPSADSMELNRYVAWNYVENHWTVGRLERTAWAQAGVWPKPILAGLGGALYEHETGFTADGETIGGLRYVQTGALEIGAAGERLVVARRLLPDERTQGQTQVSFSLRNTPNGPETVQGPYQLSDYTDLRWTARQMAIRIEGVEDADWRVGEMRLDVAAGSGR